MKIVLWVALVTMAAGCAKDSVGQNTRGTLEAGVVVDFENMKVGHKPAGFAMATTGPGSAGEWFVREDATAAKGKKVLVQLSQEATSGRFPVCVLEDLEAADVSVAVAFKPISGRVDQAAGIVVRYRDKDNYYLARANALEDNVRFYKVEEGRRRQLAGVDGMKAPKAGDWHSLNLKAAGKKFEVGMDGRKLFEVTDETFKEAGGVGLWTKGDSVTEFDDFRVVVK